MSKSAEFLNLAPRVVKINSIVVQCDVYSVEFESELSEPIRNVIVSKSVSFSNNKLIISNRFCLRKSDYYITICSCSICHIRRQFKVVFIRSNVKKKSLRLVLVLSSCYSINDELVRAQSFTDIYQNHEWIGLVNWILFVVVNEVWIIRIEQVFNAVRAFGNIKRPRIIIALKKRSSKLGVFIIERLSVRARKDVFWCKFRISLITRRKRISHVIDVCWSIRLNNANTEACKRSANSSTSWHISLI